MKLLLHIVLIFSLYLSNSAACSTSNIDSEMKALYAHFVNAASQDGNLQAGFIRAGFHDCATTVFGKPNTGCNGSLRSEGNVGPNFRLQPTIEFITSAKDLLAPCVSHADTFLIAYAAACKTGAGISIVTLLVDPSYPRSDVADGVVDENEGGRLSLPSPRSDFTELVNFYAERGMDARDLASSLAIGHAFGSVRSRLEDPEFLLDNFTVTPNKAAPFFTSHLLWRTETNAEKDLEGFHTLPSDMALGSDPAGLSILKEYARYKIMGSGKPSRGNGHGGGEKLRFSWTGFQEQRALKDFQVFSVKMSQLTGDIMTNGGGFNIPSAANTLRKMTLGWDGPQNGNFVAKGFSADLNPQLSSKSDNQKVWSKVGPNFFQKFTEVP